MCKTMQNMLMFSMYNMWSLVGFLFHPCMSADQHCLSKHPRGATLQQTAINSNKSDFILINFSCRPRQFNIRYETNMYLPSNFDTWYRWFCSDYKSFKHNSQLATKIHWKGWICCLWHMIQSCDVHATPTGYREALLLWIRETRLCQRFYSKTICCDQYWGRGPQILRVCIQGTFFLGHHVVAWQPIHPWAIRR